MSEVIIPQGDALDVDARSQNYNWPIPAVGNRMVYDCPRISVTFENIDAVLYSVEQTLANKVDKVAGKGLSDQNYTQAEKDKLAGLESSKFRGQYVSLAALIAANPTPEVGSYANIDTGVGDDVKRAIWDSTDGKWVVQDMSAPDMTPAQVKALYEENADTNSFTDAEKSKLAGISPGATANASDAQLRDRSTHTGTQAISTVSGLQAALEKRLLNTANAVSATKLQTARRISGVEFDGTANVEDGYVTNAAASGSVALDVNKAIHNLTVSGALTLSVSNLPPLSEQSRTIVVIITQGATANTITWWSGITWLAVTTPPTPGPYKTVEYILTYVGSGWIGRRGASN